MTSPNILTSSLISVVMAESKSRFATLSDEDLKFLRDDEDAKSTKKGHKVSSESFPSVFEGEKKTDETQTKDTLANVVKLFHEKLEKGMALPIQRAH